MTTLSYDFSITIGGAIGAEGVGTGFLRLIDQMPAGPDFDGAFQTQKQIVDHLQSMASDGEAATFFLPDTTYGRLDALQAFCRDHGLLYRIEVCPEGAEEMDEVIAWRPGMKGPRTVKLSKGQPLVSAIEVNGALGVGVEFVRDLVHTVFIETMHNGVPALEISHTAIEAMQLSAKTIDFAVERDSFDSAPDND